MRANNWTIALLTASIASSVSDAFAPNPRVAIKSLRSPARTSPLFFENCVDCEIPVEQASELLLYEPSDSITWKVPTQPTLPTLRDVSLSLFPEEDGDGIKPYPLVIKPRAKTSVEFLSRFLENNREWLDQQMVNYGAVLFRGFDVKTAEDVEASVLSFQPSLNNEYRGTSPRSTQGTTDYVFSAAEVPSNFPIAQHLEMSFLPQPPKQLFFSALKAPQVAGGETALADFRKVFQDVPKRLRDKLATKKIRYRRTYERVGAKKSIDVSSMKGWPELFGTNEKSEVDRLSRAENVPSKWEGRNQDTWVSEFVSEPFQLHPETKEPVWFNHAQVFHWTSFPAELMLAFRRTKDARYLVRSIYLFMLSFVKYGLMGKKMALDVSFGDGTPISAWEMHQIRKAIHKNMVLNRWERGDVLFIDNFSTSHGRQPTYDAGRQVVVAWSDPIKKSNEPVLVNGVEHIAHEWQ